MAGDPYKADPTKRPLTGKQRAFAECILNGMRPAQAYREAYKSNMTPAATSVEAQRTLRVPHVAHFIETERAKMDAAALLTRVEKRKHLATIVRNGKGRAGDRIRAIEVDNAMTGDNAPQKVEVFGLAELMKLVRSGSSS